MALSEPPITITIRGGVGTGKTTLAKVLAAYLDSWSYHVEAVLDGPNPPVPREEWFRARESFSRFLKAGRTPPKTPIVIRTEVTPEKDRCCFCGGTNTTRGDISMGGLSIECHDCNRQFVKGT